MSQRRRHFSREPPLPAGEGGMGEAGIQKGPVETALLKGTAVACRRGRGGAAGHQKGPAAMAHLKVTAVAHTAVHQMVIG